MVNMMSRILDREGKEKDRPKKKKTHRSEKTDLTVTIASTQKTVKQGTAVVGENSAKDVAGCSNPPPVDPPALSSKAGSDDAVPPKTAVGGSFDLVFSPSRVVHLKMDDGEGVVDSPKPTEQKGSAPVVVVEDNSSRSQQADPDSVKKRKRAKSTAERFMMMTKKLKDKNKAASVRSGTTSLQHKPREKEIPEGFVTPSDKPGGLQSNSAASVTISDIFKDMDALQKQDKLLDTPETMNEPDHPVDDAVRSQGAAPNSKALMKARMLELNVKMEKLRQSLDKPQPPDPLAKDDSEPSMKPGDLEASLPPLLPPAPSFSLNLNTGGGEELTDFKGLLVILKEKVKDLEVQAETVRVKEEDMRVVLEVERRERLERERASQEQIAALVARLEREKKANRKLDDDCKYYREKYLHLTRKVGGSRRPSNVNDDGRRGSSRQAARETSNPPAVRAVDHVATTGETAAALPARMIPAARIERDVARLHSTIRHLHHNLSQMYATLLQLGEQVTHLHRENPSPDRRQQ